MPSFNELAQQTQNRAASLSNAIGQGFQGVGNFFFSKPDRPTWKPGGSNKENQPRAAAGKNPQTWTENYPGVGEVVFGPGHRVLGHWKGNNFITTPGVGPSAAQPITTGLDSGGNIDRTQSDQYRAAMGQRGPAAPAYPSFPLTPQGQFERYFSSGSPEMDQYFGAASRGAGAPKTLEEMNALAAMTKAPTTSPLSTYYRAQSAAGRGNMDEIVSGLGYTGAMAEWAKANPMLAQREYAKKFPGGRSAVSFEPGAVAGLNVPVETAFANRPFATAQVPVETQAFPAQNVLRGVDPYGMPNLMAPTGQGFDTSQLYGKGAPNLAAFTLPGGPIKQGSQVSAPFQQAANMAFQRTNPMNFDVEAQKAAVGDTDLQRRITNFLGTTAVR